MTFSTFQMIRSHTLMNGEEAGAHIVKIMFPQFITREKLEKVNFMNLIDLNYLSH